MVQSINQTSVPNVSEIIQTKVYPLFQNMNQTSVPNVSEHKQKFTQCFRT